MILNWIGVIKEPINRDYIIQSWYGAKYSF